MTLRTHDDGPLDVLRHLLDDLLSERSGMGRSSDQDGRLDIVNDCKTGISVFS